MAQKVKDYSYEYDTATYELADTGTRLIALIIDNILLGIITGILVGTMRGTGAGASFIVGLAYYWLFWTRNAGQSPGKMLMKIRVVKADGSPLEFTDVLLRYVGYYISGFIFGLGYFWALWDDKRQGWHDKIASTYVVRA